jgi:hypothetical protein
MSQTLTFKYDESYFPPFPMMEIEVDGYNGMPLMHVTALVDSGADATMIPANILEVLDASYKDSMKMVGITNGMKIVDRYFIGIKVGSYIVRAVYAVAHEGEAIIGRDVLNELSVMLNGPAFMTEVYLD